MPDASALARIHALESGVGMPPSQPQDAAEYAGQVAAPPDDSDPLFDSMVAEPEEPADGQPPAPPEVDAPAEPAQEAPPEPAGTPLEIATAQNQEAIRALLQDQQLARVEAQQRQAAAQRAAEQQAQAAQYSDEAIARRMVELGMNPTDPVHVLAFNNELRSIQAFQAMERRQAALEQHLQQERVRAVATQTAQSMAAHPNIVGLPAPIQQELQGRVQALIQRGVPADQALAAIVSEPMLKYIPRAPAAPVAPMRRLDPKTQQAISAVSVQGRTAQRPTRPEQPLSREDRISRLQSMERFGRRPS